jgi:hypothetical protein
VLVELYDKINYSLLKIPLHFPKLFDTTGEMLLTCAEGIADLGQSILYFVAVAVAVVHRTHGKELFTGESFFHCVLWHNGRPFKDRLIGSSH